MSNTNNNMQTQTSNTLHNVIMEAGSKYRPPMLAPVNYVQWKSRINRYIDTKPNHELIHYCLEIPPYNLDWKDIEVPVSEGSPITTTARIHETYKNVSQEIRDQLNAEAEAVQIILTGIDNDIYSTVDACPNTYEMWKAIERLKQGESINVQDLETNMYWESGKFTSQDGESLESYYSRFYKMMNELIRNQCNVTNHQVNVQFLLQLQPEWQRFMTLVKQSQELKTISYHKLYGILKQHQHEVNEIRAEKIARVSNPLALVAQQQPDKEIDKLMALISLSFKKIYKPTNNNLRTSSKTSRTNQDNSLRINRSAGYENQSKEYASQMKLDCAKVRGDLLSYKMDYHKSCTKYTDTINDLNQTISKMKDKLSAHQETISILSQQKEAQIKLYKTREDKELDKVIELENKVKVLDNIVYKTDQSVQTMNMLNNKMLNEFCKT
nr:hypothetical protein [Tanacetum cinerariifolium]